MSNVTDIAQAGLNVVSDPCLGTVAGLLNQLHEAEADAGPVEATIGIGLCKAVGPLRVIVWARQNPWIFAIVAGSIVGGIGYAGYRVGKRIHSGRSGGVAGYLR